MHAFQFNSSALQEPCHRWFMRRLPNRGLPITSQMKHWHANSKPRWLFPLGELPILSEDSPHRFNGEGKDGIDAWLPVAT